MTRHLSAPASTGARRAALVVGLLAANAAAAQPVPVSVPRVAPTEQAARDVDRLAILQEELAAEVKRQADASRRRAERLAAGDRPGAEEAEGALQRSNANVQALQREIDSTRRASTPGNAAASAARKPPPASSVAAPPAAWWDVYSRPPRREDARVSAEQGVNLGAGRATP